MDFVQQASEQRRERIELSELTVSIKCGESDTTTGLGSCPTVGAVVDRLVDAGATVFFGETSELTGGEHLVAARMATDELREAFLGAYDGYVVGDRARAASTCSARSRRRETSPAASRRSRRRRSGTSRRRARARWSAS